MAAYGLHRPAYTRVSFVSAAETDPMLSALETRGAELLGSLALHLPHVPAPLLLPTFSAVITYALLQV